MPAQSAHFLSPRAGKQGHNDVGAYPQPGVVGCCQDRLGLDLRERLGRPPHTSLGNLAEQDDIPAYLVPGLGFLESAPKDRMKDQKRPAAQDCRFSGKEAPTDAC
jgi:hypothetical protein